MRADIAPGGIFPDYELPDHTKTRRKLSELQGDDPMILMLARGHYCPKEHQQHLELAAFPAADRGRLHPDRHDLDRRITDTRRSSAHRSAPTGPSSPTPVARSRRSSTSRSTPTPTTTR